MADKAQGPIDRITRTAQAISASDFTQRINHQGPADDLARLTITLDRMLDRLQAAFEHERRFIANASHELRTPLTVIKGGIGVTLNRLRTPAEYEITLQDLEKETDRLIRLTHDLLFLTRLEQKPSFCLRFPIDMRDLLTALVEQMQPLAEMKQITLVEKFPAELLIQGHPNYLISLFSNLLDNAIKYTLPTGRVTVQAQSKGNQVLVAVHDTGVGISQEHLPHVFERFYRVEGARSRSTGGAGLGLAIAYEIVRLHGGSLTVESQLNQGTVFTVSLP
ncbi:ATP-binding protein [Lyngbya aestuarii]|uniref:ATP-binding protein n=1 Tax=Lyngbya aestuarii TaxID=118322 RepID=UPI00403DF4C3